MTDHLFKRCQVIILDEAHERTEATDVLLALLKGKVLREHHDLKLIIMSATLEISSFQRYFNKALLMEIPGRLHQVEIIHTKTEVQDYFVKAIEIVIYIKRLEISFYL